MAQAKGKYWLANNPSAEITNAEAAELDALLPAIPQAAEIDLVDSGGGGVADGTIAAITGDATVKDAITELSTKVNNLLAKLRLAKIIS